MPARQDSITPEMERNLAGFTQLAFEATVKTIAEKPDDARLANLARRMERLADKQINQANEQATVKPACGAGCWYCCTQEVLASVPEILEMAAYIRENWSQEEIDELLVKCEAYRPIATAYVTGKSDHFQTTPCPLLKDAKCSIWPARCLVCRGYNSLDVKPCIERMNNPAATTPIPTLETHRAAADAFQDGIWEGLRRNRLYPEACDMILGLEIALTVPNAGQRFAQGDPLFAPAACRELQMAR